MRFAPGISLLLIFSAGFCSRAAAEDMQVVTSDGVVIRGTYDAPQSDSAPALLLIHMLRKNRESWADFARFAHERGFAVLAIDLRGHGESTQSQRGPIHENSFVEADFAAMKLDVAAAVRWLRRRPEIAPRGISLVGASIGASVAVAYAAEDSLIAAVALISPGETYRGVQSGPPLRAYGARPLLMVAAEDDNYSLVSVRKLESLADSSKVVHVFPEGGHGTYLLESHPELRGMIVDFVRAAAR
jgi:pimeloyl-ACP methyl ester carboxylesterase